MQEAKENAFFRPPLPNADSIDVSFEKSPGNICTVGHVNAHKNAKAGDTAYWRNPENPKKSVYFSKITQVTRQGAVTTSAGPLPDGLQIKAASQRRVK